MQKKIGAILLVAGTCIGSGMIALPMVLAKLGLIASIVLMAFIWYIMYYTSLINLELNLQAGTGLPLGKLGRLYSGKMAEFIGTISLKLLSYALLAAFIYGGTSIVQKLLVANTGFNLIATCYAVIAMLILLFPIKWIDYCNRILFTALISIVAILIGCLIASINFTDMPLFSKQDSDISIWLALIPIVFTSFGFQVIFHTLTNYCNKDKKILKQAFFWGSLIPAVVYIAWTCGVLSVVYHNNPLFYSQMENGNIEVGDLIQVLGQVTGSKSLQILIWWVSILAIGTSVIGVGIGLVDNLKDMLSRVVRIAWARNSIAVLATILPPYLIAILVPNAFIGALAFAGMILAIIAVLLPVYLLKQIKCAFFYPELMKKWLVRISVLIALFVVFSSFFN